jgi:hypothetical protein
MKSAKTQKGTALVMALVLVPVLMLLAATFVDPIVRSYRAAVADQKSLLARNIAENFFEEAMLASQDTGVGETVHHPQDPDPITRDYGFGVAQGTWTVYQTPETDAEHLITVAGQDYYTIPSPGSGDAGGDYCSTNEPVVTAEALAGMQDFLGISPKPLDGSVDENHILEWPCHWNKLKEGESVTIPLYIETADGTVMNPGFSLDSSGNINTMGGLGLDNFELVIRPACNPGIIGGRPYENEICAPGTTLTSGERYQLQGDPLTPDETVIVLWQIVGEEVDSSGNPTGRQVYLAPFGIGWTDSNIYNADINSYFTSPSNNLNDSSPTEDNDGIKNSTIIEHLKNTHTGTHEYINKPVLRLQVVHSLFNEIYQKVPYLEYQFKSPDIEEPVSSTSKVVSVDVMVEGGYSETIERTIPLPKPVTGFVIQQ